MRACAAPHRISPSPSLLRSTVDRALTPQFTMPPHIRVLAESAQHTISSLLTPMLCSQRHSSEVSAYAWRRASSGFPPSTAATSRAAGSRMHACPPSLALVIPVPSPALRLSAAIASRGALGSSIYREVENVILDDLRRNQSHRGREHLALRPAEQHVGCDEDGGEVELRLGGGHASEEGQHAGLLHEELLQLRDRRRLAHVAHDDRSVLGHAAHDEPHAHLPQCGQRRGADEKV
mmetsp:Transcript_15985/g.41174  ORF Transcript_15985/g.41174 Transcript_15985/m.41174 type:complete len:235 (-) Transcript_15985:93-797(-)